MGVVIPEESAPQGRKVGEQDRGKEEACHAHGIEVRPGRLCGPGNGKGRHGANSA